jgi:hypothetical protein
MSQCDAALIILGEIPVVNTDFKNEIITAQAMGIREFIIAINFTDKMPS